MAGGHVCQEVCMRGGHAWQRACMGGVRDRTDGHFSGRYVSYWNSFLFYNSFCHMYGFFSKSLRKIP